MTFFCTVFSNFYYCINLEQWTDSLTENVGVGIFYQELKDTVQPVRLQYLSRPWYKILFIIHSLKFHSLKSPSYHFKHKDFIVGFGFSDFTSTCQPSVIYVKFIIFSMGAHHKKIQSVMLKWQVLNIEVFSQNKVTLCTGSWLGGW